MPKLANSRGRRVRKRVQPAKSSGSARPGTKQALLIDLLKRKKGATIAEAVDALGYNRTRCEGRSAAPSRRSLDST